MKALHVGSQRPSLLRLYIPHHQAHADLDSDPLVNRNRISSSVKLGITASKDLRPSLESLQIKLGVEAIARVVLLKTLVEV